MYVPVVADVDGHVARAVEDVAGLRLRERYAPELLVLGTRVVAYADARLRVAVLREPAAVERLAGGRASPHVGHAELAVRRLDDRVPVRGRVLQVLDRHGVEPVEAPLRHDRLQGLDVGRVGRPAGVLEPLGHPVRVVSLDRLADEGVARVALRLQEDPAAEADALGVAGEADEARRDLGVLAGHVLLAGGPVRLAGHLGAARVARPPLHAEKVVVALCELAHAVALAGLLDDLRDGAARRVPVLLLALERRLDHLVGDVGRQPLEALLGGRVVPEAEQRAQQLRDGERACDEGHDPGHRPEQGGRRARDRARDRGGGALRPRGSGRLARRLRGRLGRLMLGRGGRAGCLGAARASLWGAEGGRRLAAALGCFLRLPLPQPSRGLLGRTPRVVHARGALELLRVVELGDGLPGDRQLRRIDARAHRGRRAPVAGWLGQFVPEPAFRRVGPGRAPLRRCGGASRLVERAGTLRDVSQGVALGLRDVARGEHVAALRPDHLEHPAALARAGHSYSSASRAARRISRSATSAGLVFHRS